MKKGAKRNQIISELLHVTDEEFTDEELIHQLIATEVTKNADKDEHMTFGQRAADAVARFAGSWAFIFSFIAVMVIWMVINLVLGSRAFDEYPFILLNLVLSCIAAVQAPLIMMSQNRQEAKDRRIKKASPSVKERRRISPPFWNRKSRCTRCGFGASAFCCLSISNFTLLRSKAYGHYRGLCRRLA